MTWSHRDVDLPWGPETAITIEWCGIDCQYQGMRTDEDVSIARKIFETAEARARSHENSTPSMPIFLEVDVDNPHALGVWEKLGFEYLESVEVLQKGRYRRMIRSASAD